VFFDLEGPSELTPLRHGIVICPWWTQKPLLHSVKSEEKVEQLILQDLLASRPYFWRYYKRSCLCHTYWQITTVHDIIPTIDVDGQAVPYNTSFYLIAPHEYPAHVHVHDHRSSLHYNLHIQLAAFPPWMRRGHPYWLQCGDRCPSWTLPAPFRASRG
jgi:hypothetical protein